MNKLIMIFLVFLFIPISNAEVISIVSMNDLAIDKESIGNAHINIEANDESGLSSGIIKVSFNPDIVQLLKVNDGDFDAYTYNINNELGYVIIVAYQTGIDGVQPGLIQFADLEFKAVGVEGSESALSIEVDSITNNTGILIPNQINNGVFSINGEAPKENIIDSAQSNQNNFEVNIDRNEDNSVIEENLPDNVATSKISSSISGNNSDGIDKEKTEFIPGFSALFLLIVISMLKKLVRVDIK